MLQAVPGSGERRERAAAAMSVGEASGGRWRRWLSGVTVMEEEVAAAAVAAVAAAAAAAAAVMAAAAVSVGLARLYVLQAAGVHARSGLPFCRDSTTLQLY